MGASADFNGTTDYASYNVDILGGASEATWVQTVYYDNLQAENKPMAQWDGGTFAWLHSLLSNGTYRLFINTAGGGCYKTTNIGAVTAGSWNTYAFSWSGGANMKLYVDGDEITLNDAGSSASPTTIVNTGALLGLGAAGTGSRPCDGKICYTHIYDRGLSQEEVKELLYKPGSVTENLKLYVPGIGTGTDLTYDIIRGDAGTQNGSISESFDGPPVQFY
jgi:hypothetical protein